MTRHDPNWWEEKLINALPIFILPIAGLCGLLAIQTINYYEQNQPPTTQKRIELDESTCARLEVELNASADEGLLTKDEVGVIVRRCLRLFGEGS